MGLPQSGLSRTLKTLFSAVNMTSTTIPSAADAQVRVSQTAEQIGHIKANLRKALYDVPRSKWRDTTT